MILILDLGNSDLSVAIFKGDKIYATFRTPCDRRKGIDEYVKVLLDMLQTRGISPTDIEGAILSSVVPQLTKIVKGATKRLIGKEPLVLGVGFKTGLAFKADNPNEVGADLVAVCVGALKHYEPPIVIVDLGTATKILAIDKNRVYCGVAIAPGVKTSSENLIRIAPQLPYTGLVKPKKVLATNTIDALNSGIVCGNASMVDGMIRKFERELGGKATRILTGGLSSTISVAMEEEHIVDKNLIFYGLYEIYLKNVGSKQIYLFMKSVMLYN